MATITPPTSKRSLFTPEQDEYRESFRRFLQAEVVPHYPAWEAARVVPRELFTRCAGWTHETEGAFGIATGALTKAWGFLRRQGRVRGSLLFRCKSHLRKRRDPQSAQSGPQRGRLVRRQRRTGGGR